jgi:hypothetical protein
MKSVKSAICHYPYARVHFCEKSGNGLFISAMQNHGLHGLRGHKDYS